ncbi:glycosyltransferase family 4 protein [Actinosynnema sp. NPDC091369]
MTVHFVRPRDDPASPSGGNAYDRRVIQELGSVHDVEVPGAWPRPDPADRAALGRVLGGIGDGSVVVLDGLVACGVPDVVVPHADRLRLVVLVHLPLADETGLEPSEASRLDAAERECLRAVRAVVATSPSAARRLVSHHSLARVHVVTPGVDPAPLATGTDGASRLLCVASVTPRKGHDVLVRALASVADLPWTCAFVGAERWPVREVVERHGLGARIELTGPLDGPPLDRAYATADLFVLASWAETYGMVVTEALARGVPVVASAVPDALGDGGVLLPSGDVEAFADAVRRWLTDDAWRRDLRGRALARRRELSTWDETATRLAEVLASLRP